MSSMYFRFLLFRNTHPARWIQRGIIIKLNQGRDSKTVAVD